MNIRGQTCWACCLSVLLIVFGGCEERKIDNCTPQMQAPEQFWIRVLLVENARQCNLAWPAAFSVIEAKELGRQVRLEQSGEAINVQAAADGIRIGGELFRGREVIVSPERPHIFELNGCAYRGKLKLILHGDNGTLEVVNFVPLEPYLAGVVGAEMPDYWELAALRAQAIAARTYCLYMKKRFGPNRRWDVRKTQANQVYVGVSRESRQVWDAINKTTGHVLYCKADDGTEQLFPAYYSSTCGGHTENSRNVFGDSYEPLAGVRCDYCKDVARPEFFFWPAVHLDEAEVTARLLARYPTLKRLGQVTAIVASRRSNYGRFSRLTLVRLLGSSGSSDVLRAEDLRLTLDPTGRKLRSTICRLTNADGKWSFSSGRGYGHGVGMCQCGAQSMARRGKTARQILQHYYPGSKIVSVY
ncbi:MAG: SpoIID/LytB domain-containing protein [Planctomycetota bacterium]